MERDTLWFRRSLSHSTLARQGAEKENLGQFALAGGSQPVLSLSQEEIRSRSATWQLVAGLGSCDPPE